MLRPPTPETRGVDKAPDQSVCLALNEPCWPPPAAVREATRAAVDDLHRYPSTRDGHLLVALLAEQHHVPPEQIVVGAGASGLLREILLALGLPHRRREVVFAAPGFDLYGLLPGHLGGWAIPVSLTPDGDQDLEAMVRACNERTAAVVVCNPHNPTGTAVRGAELRRFLTQVPDHVTVLLDEAYCAYVTDPEVPVSARPADRGFTRSDVAILRSFSKSHSLGGARVGYLVAPTPLADAVRARVMPFSVTRVGYAGAAAALDASSTGEYAIRWASITAARAELRATLGALGYTVPESHANFLWLALSDLSTTFAEHCASQRVLVRDYPARGVRVTVGSPADNKAFLAAARTFRELRRPA